MNNDDIKKIIYDFFEFVDVLALEVDNRESRFLAILDLLGASQIHVQYEFDEKDYPDYPRIDQIRLRERISLNFSDYGYYNCVSDMDINTIEQVSIMVGDAIDDIVDIYNELSKVLWSLENTSEDDAFWHYEYSYQSHWGTHLRNLQLYVFSKMEK